MRKNTFILLFWVFCYAHCYSQSIDTLLVDFLRNTSADAHTRHQIVHFMQPRKYQEEEKLASSLFHKIEIAIAYPNKSFEHTTLTYVASIGKDSLKIVKSYFKSGFLKSVTILHNIHRALRISYYKKPRHKEMLIYVVENGKYNGKAVYYGDDGRPFQEITLKNGLLGECRQYALTKDNILYIYKNDEKGAKYITCDTYINNKLFEFPHSMQFLMPSILLHLPSDYFDEKVVYELKNR